MRRKQALFNSYLFKDTSTKKDADEAEKFAEKILETSNNNISKVQSITNYNKTISIRSKFEKTDKTDKSKDMNATEEYKEEVDFSDLSSVKQNQSLLMGNKNMMDSIIKQEYIGDHSLVHNPNENDNRENSILTSSLDEQIKIPV